MERVSLVGRYDLEWIPERAERASRRAWRWTWVPSLGGIVLLAGRALLGFGSFPQQMIGIAALVLAGAGAEVLRSLHAARLARAELHQLATDTAHLRLVGTVADDELVRVRGRVRLREAAGGSPSSGLEPGVVFARTREPRRVHERAVDFSLIDESGGEIWIEVEGARLLHPSGNQWALLDHVVRAGDVVEIIGWKDRRVDQRVTDRLGREVPMRATLRSGTSLPLLIVPGAHKALAAPSIGRLGDGSK